MDQAADTRNLRADVYWQSGNWELAGEKSEELIASRRSGTGRAVAIRPRMLMRSAIAYSLAGNQTSAEPVARPLRKPSCRVRRRERLRGGHRKSRTRKGRRSGRRRARGLRRHAAGVHGRFPQTQRGFQLTVLLAKRHPTVIARFMRATHFLVVTHFSASGLKPRAFRRPPLHAL